VEKAMKHTMSLHPEVEVVEFTVAPQVTPSEGLPHHEWFVEFASEPKNIEKFRDDLDDQLQKLNTYYYDLVSGNILSRLKIVPLRREAFQSYMKSKGKLGGQNKVPRLANDRTLASDLVNYKV